METHLTIKHLAGYLPYELSFLNIYSKLCLTMSGLQEDRIYNHGHEYMDFEYIKPILRPLSDLTKKIEVNGEKFVPLELLGKIYEPKGIFEDEVFGWDCATGGDDYQDYYYVIESDLTYSISCGNPNDSYSYSIESGNLHFNIIQKLLEWHFDIHGLIQAGLAIDINTLNKQ